MTTNLAKIFETYRMSPREAALQSKTWFNQQLFILGQTQATAEAMMRQAKLAKAIKKKTDFIPGSMYLFEYHAKHADTLPYWDRYPLVIPFRQVQDGFYGLNMHYLAPQFRVALLDRLMTFATNKTLDENTKLKFTWQTAAACAKNKSITSCVKMYLTTQLQSQFMFIKPEDWVGALMLPTESFVGASKSSVWKESRRV